MEITVVQSRMHLIIVFISLIVLVVRITEFYAAYGCPTVITDRTAFAIFIDMISHYINIKCSLFDVISTAVVGKKSKSIL